ncbi:MAG TPA: sulfurtransferase TusA family protein [Thermoanaerobaculia bacterium]|nr:sulfurtransferase TusA family protein [Thermoanaerobaculia bacterium]
MPARALDVTGTLCPVPVLLARRAMRALGPGDLLEVVGDDPAMVVDVPVWAEKDGHRLVELAKEPGGRVRCLVEKGRGGPGL